MLHLPLNSITETGLELDQTVDVVDLQPLAAHTREGDAAFNGSVQVSIRAQRSGETIAIEGHARTEVRLTCSRCLTEFDQRLEAVFSARAMPQRQVPTVAAGDEIELSAEDMDSLEYEGNSVDLRGEVAQQLIMALPFNPLCRPSCKGLCSRCGVDLNRASCECSAAEATSPFAVLKTFRLPEKKD